MAQAETQVAQTRTALTPQQKKASTLAAYLKTKEAAFAALLPSTLKPEKMMKGFWAAAARNPKILECTAASVLNCFMVASSLGLEIGRLRGGMHVVPFGNTLTPVPDYRGLMDLAFRSGQVLGIRAVAAYDGDQFDYAEGTDDRIVHVPKLDADRSAGKLKFVYAVAHLKEARPQFVVLTRQEVEQHRARSKAKDNGPWVTDYVAMALKTAIKGLCNWLPSAPEKLVQAVELDDRVERGESQAGIFDFEIEGEAVKDDTAGSTDKLAADLKAQADATKEQPDNSLEGRSTGPTEAAANQGQQTPEAGDTETVPAASANQLNLIHKLGKELGFADVPGALYGEYSVEKMESMTFKQAETVIADWSKRKRESGKGKK